MYRYLIVSLFMNICFSKFMIGVDFASTFNGSDDIDKLDIGLSLSYDYIIESKFGFGFEYLFPTEMEDAPEINVSLLSLYGMYDFIDNVDMTISGKIGYSIPRIDFDIQEIINITDTYPFDFNIDNSGGILYGIKASFGPMNIIYSFHRCQFRYTDMKYNGIPISIYTDDFSYNLKRITASYSF